MKTLTTLPTLSDSLTIAYSSHASEKAALASSRKAIREGREFVRIDAQAANSLHHARWYVLVKG